MGPYERGQPVPRTGYVNTQGHSPVPGSGQHENRVAGRGVVVSSQGQFQGRTFSQPAFQQPGFPHPGFPQPGFPQPGFPSGFQPAGVPVPRQHPQGQPVPRQSNLAGRARPAQGSSVEVYEVIHTNTNGRRGN